MKKTIITIAVIVLCARATAQDTITIMQYNLLNYGNITSYCPADSNTVPDKNAWTKTIFDYVKPTIFTVNELNRQPVMHDSLLHNVMNTNGVTYYKLAPTTNTTNTYLMNALYYDSRKVECAARYVAQNYVRDATVYKMYYLSPDLQRGDTVFFFCSLVHLKAGYADGNDEDRGIMANNLMSWIEDFDSLGEHNFMVMGDFNVYTHTEAAFQAFTNHSDSLIRFYDPINQIGSWNSNPAFAAYHTQSTRSGNGSGCASTGGLDDRFDYILFNRNIKDHSAGLGYVEGSYKNLGNDGNHYNKSIIADGNNSVPPAVLNALYHNSDHLPIVMKLAVDATPSVGLVQPEYTPLAVRLSPNPTGSTLNVDIDDNSDGTWYTISIVAPNGRVMRCVNTQERRCNIPVEILSQGLYMAIVTTGDGRHCAMKFVKR